MTKTAAHTDHINVVLVHCHDLGRWLSIYGLESVPSPNLAHLAESSVVFDQAFSTAPLCTPARSSLFTGCSPHANGLMGLAHGGWRYRQSVVTLPEMMAQAGYDTALVGLQHEHPDSNVLGFDEVRGNGFLPRAWPVVEEAATWLADRPIGGRPFFLTVGVWEVHRPWRREDYDFARPEDVEVPPYLPDNPDTREDLASFYGSIRQLDEAVGFLLGRVDAHSDPASTMILMTTDHGAALPRAKSTLYDSGVGVTFVVRPPTSWNVLPGRRASQVSHLDIAPTLLDIAGVEAGPELEGRSLLPYLLDGDPIEDDRRLYLEKTYHDSYDPQRAVRTARWKYVRNWAEGPKLTLALDLERSATRRGMGDAHLAPRPAAELYDLMADPAELVNIIDHPGSAEVAAALDADLQNWMQRTHDPLLSGDVPPPPPPKRQGEAAPDLIEQATAASNARVTVGDAGRVG